jgi:hypothetical protein
MRKSFMLANVQVLERKNMTLRQTPLKGVLFLVPVLCGDKFLETASFSKRIESKL